MEGRSVVDEEFFARSTLAVARDLLGLVLVRESEEGVVAGRIVETEAYLHDDPAAHTFGGRSERNRAMFGPPGRAYVYFIYGMYYCLNCTTNESGVGEGVLVRALEPVAGVELMKRRRGTDDILNLCSGPGKLTIALGVDMDDYGVVLTSEDSALRLERPAQQQEFSVVEATRIGVSKAAALPHRFYVEGNPHVSKR